MFTELLDKITSVASLGFEQATDNLIDYVSSTDGFDDILKQIGTIPESIAHSSTEEKLFSKASDAVLARAFREIGLKSSVIKERSDSADVLVESPIFGYSMAADAKAFRMSRTARNQKDFKVTALSGWRKDADYAVLCAPFYQYPKSESQIYFQSIEHNVCLLSWEHLVFMLKHNICETERLDLSPIWNFGKTYSFSVIAANMKKCYLESFSQQVAATVGVENGKCNAVLANQIKVIKERGEFEKAFWENKKIATLSLTRKQAVNELIKSMKIDEKITQIDQYVRGLRYD